MSKKVPTVPLISSTFALLDVMKGRAALEKVVAAGYRVPVTITGYIQNGRGGVSRDDGTSREFSIDVDTVVMRDAEFVPADKIGRPYARVGDLARRRLHVAPGDKITLDDGFTCIKASERDKPRRLFGAENGDLYFKCVRRRKHFLSGQIGEHDEYVGVYKVG
jgi:hypothetical protein